jgi:hypothetical protein
LNQSQFIRIPGESASGKVRTVSGILDKEGVIIGELKLEIRRQFELSLLVQQVDRCMMHHAQAGSDGCVLAWTR